MDVIDPIITIAEKLHALCKEVKANKERCKRLDQRVAALVQVVKVVKVHGLGPHPELVEKGLGDLMGTLMSAHLVVKNFLSTGSLKRIRKAFKLSEEFESLNMELNDAAQVLSLALQVDQRQRLEKVFLEVRRVNEDAEDRRVDQLDLKKLLESLEETKESVDAVHDVVTSTRDDVKDIKALLESLMKFSEQRTDIQEIKPDKLTYDVPIMKSDTYELFKGEYNKFTVAIKRFSCQSSPDEIRKIFTKEVETMRRFESPNVLRMFGICIENEQGPCPNYIIVTEFCEKGSLRQVLDGQSELPWEMRARMSLDAAQGIYRLHQSEVKFKVHGSICSSKFLVDAGYRVKLGGFELAKTETSLKNNKGKKSSSIIYCSPQQIESVNHPYDKNCEIYSFGIVLWEIATRQIPFKGPGCSSREIHQRVCKEKMKEPLPADCPTNLVKIIDSCRAYEPFYRPSAGALVDKLRDVVDELDRD